MANLVRTEMGLQVHTGGRAADRERRQPVQPMAAGRNAFEIATRQGNRRWEDTYVTAEQAAEFLGLSRPDLLAPYIAEKHLTPYRRMGSQRRLFRREQVEALVRPDAAA
ncbi:MAG TPA: helix-turn-helix domain-containing protein [Opitutaceae bacterium]|nr:helix-turn-helix domain-containing protein [Opitutaceae bacterium]